MPRGLPLFMDTSVLVFFLFPVQAPHRSLLLLLELRAPLTTVNAQLVFDCRAEPLSLGSLPSASLCFWVDVTYTLVLKGFKAPKELGRELTPKRSRTRCCSRTGESCRRLNLRFTRVALCSGANRMCGRGGAKWAAIPSLTLVEQKMSHASSQSWICFPVRWL